MNICTLKRICAGFWGLAITGLLNAQPGCPSVNAGPDVTIPCGSTCTTLTANAFQTGGTDTYTVSQIPYTPFSYTGGSTILVGQDDVWTCDPITLPFTFCFFGQAYTQFQIGANACVTFTPQTGCTYVFGIPFNQPYCTYPINAAVPSTTPADLLNSIMAPWHDIDPSVGGNIYYQVIGQAPCRILVVSWDQVPMFQCNNLIATSQMVLYETTNVIEIYIQNKPVCSTWNGGAAIEGIQNANGTVAYTVPGRNYPTQWTASNDAWRFTPNGPSIVTVDWFNGATQIGTGNSIQVCPSSQTTYTAKATYLPCSGGTPVVVTDDVIVSLTGSLVAGIDSAKNVTCHGANDGKAWAHVSGGTPPVTYGWSNGSTNLAQTNLAPGTYIFTASDAGSCVRRDTVIITDPPQLNAIVPNVTQTNCTGTGTGALTVNPSGGVTPYTYHWNDSQSQTTVSASNLNPGTYNVTVTDSTSCTVSASGTLTVNVGGNTLAMSAPTIKNISCFGGNDGSIIAHVTGGATPYGYAWSNTQTGDTAIDLAVGAFTVSVTDAGGCTATATYNVTQPTQLTLGAPTITNIGCSGAASGSITANPAGGTTAYSYNWVQQSNSQTYTGQTISNLSADNYGVTVTDANQCSVSASYQITQTTALTFTQTQTDVTCNGGNNGTATINVSTGTAPYNYNWNGTGAAPNNTLNGISAGTVDVTITDANCSATATFTITEPSAIVVSTVSQTNVSCNGGSDGTVTVSATGGTGTITFSWSNGQSGATVSSLGATTVTVTATDANTCSVSQSYTITEPTAVSIGQPIIQNTGCSGGNTGSISASASGGTGIFNYNWTEQSNSQTYSGQTINGLAADNYDLTVTDANNCSATATYTVAAITQLTFTQSQTDALCFGSSDGTATISVTTGTAPYQYNWNGTGASSNATVGGLHAGTTSVTITDVNCSVTATFNINQPTQISITNARQTDVSCFGGSNGSVTVTVTGGTPGYTYSWSDGETGATASTIIAGNVTVSITDINQCQITQQYTINQPNQLQSQPVATNASCYGAPNGTVDADASGGTPPYSYYWSEGQTSKVAMGLVAGSYTCTVTDANSCTAAGTGVITEPADMTINTSVTAVKCIGDKNGTITVDATGGTQPYNFSATQDGSNFVYATDGVIQGLAIGDYIVLVSDNNGCSKTTIATVPNASADNFVTTTDSTTCYGPNYNDGGAHIVPTTPANGPYQYSIDGGALQYAGDFYELSAGDHTITAVNFNGCTNEIPVVVLEPLPIVVDVVPDTVTLPLGESQAVQVNYLNATNTTYNWTPALGLSCVDCPNPVVSSYTSGDYFITVSMINRTSTCYGSATLHVNVLPHQPVFVPNSFSPNGDGNNDIFLIYGESIREINLKIFNRWGEVVFESLNEFNGWDGRYKGQLQSPQVFTYEAQITFLDDTRAEKKGTVTLIR